MYDDLVKSLRQCADASCAGCKNDLVEIGCRGLLQREAADAIEELSKERKTGEWCADYDGYSDGEPVYDMWWCSACGERFYEWDDRPTWKYCPVCGSYNGDDSDV